MGRHIRRHLFRKSELASSYSEPSKPDGMGTDDGIVPASDLSVGRPSKEKMLPLRMLRGAPPRRLVASTRPAPLATGSLLLGETTSVRSCARLVTHAQRGRPGSAFLPSGVGARHFSSRWDSDGDGGSSSFRDASLSPQQRHEPSSEEGSHSKTATTETDNGLEEDPSTSTSSSSSSSSSSTNHDNYVLKESVRVHPLSQLVLLYFQTDEGYDWICSHGVLQSSLAFRGDGTFALTFFPSAAIGNSEVEESQITHLGGELTVSAETDTKDEGPSSLPLSTPPPTCHMWTQFDATERKHWLCVSVRGKASRFLLQDYSSSAAKARREEVDDDHGAPRYTPWRVGIHGHPKPTLADRVEDAVRAAMREVDQSMLVA